jgi:nitrite reductase/ring-hydroxylating ferredoxin subunit
MRDFHLGNSISEIQEMLPEYRIKKVRLDAREIGVVRIGEKVYGFSPFCPHRGASLVQGSVNSREEIICPLHQYRFELKTGQATAGDCADLQTYPCELSEKGLKITLP